MHLPELLQKWWDYLNQKHGEGELPPPPHPGSGPVTLHPVGGAPVALGTHKAPEPTELPVDPPPVEDSKSTPPDGSFK